jgi:HEAT repeat protein
MEPFLWTFDDVVRFIDHPDLPVRRWALERLTKRFPDRAGEPLIRMLDDPNTYNVLLACTFLGETDEAKYGPILLQHLGQAEGARFGYLADALGVLGYREAVPPIAERLDTIWEGSSASTPYEYLRLVDALGTLGGEGARQALWALLDGFRDGLWAAPAIEAMLRAAQPEDVARLVRTYRRWPPLSSSRRQVRAFATAAGAKRLTEQIGYVLDAGLDEVVEQAASWIGTYPDISDACWDDLERAFERRHGRMFRILLKEARRITKRRGDDLDGWLADWEAGTPLGDYRRRATRTRLLLEAFARYPSPHPEQRIQESALGLALLFQRSIDEDDRAWLDGAQDEAEMLLHILSQDREHVLPDIVERVAALGPGIVPRLIRRFDPEGYGWEPIRIADVIARIARRYTGSCDMAVPLLIKAINDDQGDHLLESCSEALAEIGPPAVSALADHIWDDDTTRQIYLVGTLGEIPTESAAQALLAWIEQDMPVDEMHVLSLAEIGSSSAIEPLRELWTEGEHPLDNMIAESLLVLCELNNVQRPELSEWRRIVQEQQARFEQTTPDFRPWFLEEDPEREEEEMSLPSGPDLVTHEGDPVVFCQALYRHSGMQKIVHALARAGDFSLSDDLEPEPNGTLRFGWYESGPQVHRNPAEMGQRVLATLALTPETFEVETMSEQRLARCRRRLEGLLGNRIRFLQTQTKSVEQVLSEPLPEDVPEPVELSPEALADLEEQMLRQWINESIPALGGMTPLEAVRTPEGRQMVLDLLDYVKQRQEKYPPPPGMISPDYHKAKKMLGLE